MIEEKLKEKIVLDRDIRTSSYYGPSSIMEFIKLSDALSICKSEIAEACRLQRTICYNVFCDTNSPNAILHAPSPEEKL
jgi:hypothetical protein